VVNVQHGNRKFQYAPIVFQLEPPLPDA